MRQKINKTGIVLGVVNLINMPLPKNKSGFIVAICGGPGTGKSTLVNKLAEHYHDAMPIFEGEEHDFPERIKQNLKDNTNHLEVMIYFRNLLANMHLEAERLKQSGNFVIMDTFWLTNDVYAETWLDNDFHKDMMREVSKLDSLFLSMPDLIIILESNKDKVKDFMMKRGRLFEIDDDVIKRYIAAGEAHHDFFKDRPNVVFINRSQLDFNKPEDFKIVTDLIDKKLVN